MLASIAYSFESGPWRNAYVRLGYNPKLNPDSVIYQVIDFRTRDESLPVRKEVYDHTFSSLPQQQGQLYQLCDIEDDRIKKVLVNSDSISIECTVRYM